MWTKLALLAALVCVAAADGGRGFEPREEYHPAAADEHDGYDAVEAAEYHGRDSHDNDTDDDDDDDDDSSSDDDDDNDHRRRPQQEYNAYNDANEYDGGDRYRGDEHDGGDRYRGDEHDNDSSDDDDDDDSSDDDDHHHRRNNGRWGYVEAAEEEEEEEEPRFREVEVSAYSSVEVTSSLKSVWGVHDKVECIAHLAPENVVDGIPSKGSGKCAFAILPGRTGRRDAENNLVANMFWECNVNTEKLTSRPVSYELGTGVPGNVADVVETIAWDAGLRGAKAISLSDVNECLGNYCTVTVQTVRSEAADAEGELRGQVFCRAHASTTTSFSGHDIKLVKEKNKHHHRHDNDHQGGHQGGNGYH